MRSIQLLLAVAATLFGSSIYVMALADEDGSDQIEEVGRKVMGNDVPDFRSIWGLSSLTDDQREQVKALMTSCQEESKPLQDELESIKSTALQGGSLTPEQMQEASQRILSGSMPDTSPAESKVLSRVHDLRDQIKEKRTECWQQIKNVLTPEQINEVQNF